MLKNTESYNLFHIIFPPNRSYNLFHIIFSPTLQSFLWQLYDIVVRFDKIKFKIQN